MEAIKLGNMIQSGGGAGRGSYANKVEPSLKH